MVNIKGVINNVTSFLMMLDDIEKEEEWVDRLEKVNTRAYVSLMGELAYARKVLVSYDPIDLGELDALIRELDNRFVSLYPEVISKHIVLH